ncbi:hypothetical protein CAEBREN_07623 [Caenorhabditis brenneri]|uniref:Uncharacterized protein n=1 Tax=Caenorhabditis brenneri TaxID=135651 RepID=G0MM36_CAEBE|nr:hypothetical protein CAEBREN_07623 [Caenorhabditis brenneri]
MPDKNRPTISIMAGYVPPQKIDAQRPSTIEHKSNKKAREAAMIAARYTKQARDARALKRENNKKN